MPKKTISLVIPTYNEEGNIINIYQAIRNVVPPRYITEIVFVDDGSSDQTVRNIKKLASRDIRVHYLCFTRNFGQQYALKAGLDHAHGAAVVTMDADLEHPPALIPAMIREWENGYKIVITKRKAGLFSLICTSDNTLINR